MPCRQILQIGLIGLIRPIAGDAKLRADDRPPGALSASRRVARG
jgi:hypothetical protein